MLGNNNNVKYQEMRYPFYSELFVNSQKWDKTEQKEN